MKVFTLLEAEKYFTVLDVLEKQKEKVIKIKEYDAEIKTDKEVLLNKLKIHINNILTNTDKKQRIIYLLRFFSNSTERYYLKHFSIVGEYSDCVFIIDEVLDNSH